MDWAPAVLILRWIASEVFSGELSDDGRVSFQVGVFHPECAKAVETPLGLFRLPILPAPIVELR